jgi:PEP-CTERM motif
MKLNFTVKKTGLRLTLALAALLSGAGIANALPITYNINQTIGAGSVVGSITTDGALGVLGAADVTGWNLALNGVGATFNLASGSSTVYVLGSDLTATASNLFFNFDGADGGLLLFQVSLFSGLHYYCDGTAGNFACRTGASVVPASTFDASVQSITPKGNVIIASVAGVPPVPEPSTYALMLASLAAMAWVSRQRKGTRLG